MRDGFYRARRQRIWTAVGETVGFTREEHIEAIVKTLSSPHIRRKARTNGTTLHPHERAALTEEAWMFPE